MNLYEYNPKAPFKAVLILTGLWTAFWIVIVQVQKDPVSAGGILIISGMVLLFNGFILYLWWLRKWQKLCILTDQTIVSCDKRFLIPKKYKTKIHLVREVEFTVTAVNFKGGKHAKQKNVKAFRDTVTKTLEQKLSQAETLIDAMLTAHIKLEKPLSGHVAVTGIRLRGTDQKHLLFAHIEKKPELKKFLKHLTSKDIRWSWKIKWL